MMSIFKNAERRKFRLEHKKHLQQERRIRKMTADAVSGIEICSKVSCYHEPKVGSEFAQKLTLSRKGQVRLAHIGYAREEEDQTVTTEEWQISEARAAELLSRTLRDFADFFEPMCHDAGSWELSVCFQNSLVMERSCSSGREPEGYSAYLRETLNREDLFLCG